MTDDYLARLFEHNNWANAQIIQACSTLSDEQLDAPPQSATEGSIRSTLLHLVSAQYGYLRLLTLPLEQRKDRAAVEFADMEKSLKDSGERLLELAREVSNLPTERLQTRDDYLVDPWVIMVQIINHATEHREQIKSMLTAFGITPPSIDGWDYGEATKAFVPIST
ncbi:MAG TPA: DinB family protein [Anaerolineales bacterium]|nr:DinB family protein [Anaerolineales bacterium]